MNLKELQNEAHRIAREKGWWDEEKSIAKQLALIHSEISEALEDWRNGRMSIKFEDKKPVGFGIELADVLVRVGDLAEKLGIHLEKCVQVKI